MDLVPDIARAAGLSPEQAERVAGTLLAAVEMSVPRDLYEMIQKVVPRSLDLTMKGAPPLGGRTGEMRAYVAELKSEAGADRLVAQLALQGLTRDQVKAAVEALIRHLQDTQGIQGAERLLQALPGLSRLLA